MASNRNLLVLPGDGIGPEVMNEVRKIITWMGKKRAVRAREAEGDERERLWAQMVEAYPPYASYQRRTERS